MAVKNRSGFLFIFIIIILLGVIIFAYKDKFSVLLNTGVSSGKKLADKNSGKNKNSNIDKIASDKIKLMNKKENTNQDNNDVKEKIKDNIEDIKENIIEIKDKIKNSNEIKKDNNNQNKENINIVKKDQTKDENIENNKKENSNDISIKSNDQQKTKIKTGKVFFGKINNDDKIKIVGVERDVSYFDAPLTETLKVLLQGPTSKEKNYDIITNIPQNTRLLSVSVKDNVAYINFSKEFEYNGFGKESSIAQIKQVVYTATEFSNVKYVQFLIDGKVKKYLGGEGLTISRPLSRNDFS